MRVHHGLPPVEGRVEDVSPGLLDEQVRVVAHAQELVLECASDGAALLLQRGLVRRVAAADWKNGLEVSAKREGLILRIVLQKC